MRRVIVGMMLAFFSFSGNGYADVGGLPEFIQLASDSATTFPQEIQALIKEKKIQVGMTREMVKASWGEPSQLKKTKTCFGTIEDWTYEQRQDLGFADSRILRFDEDGLLQSIKGAK
ncbi:MAG: hypothetical protein HY731_14255 [Candidatus Tectomicrobia bacterium]|nr:hypothetical protein [Candidatus Tectomicrobia bacterium]